MEAQTPEQIIAQDPRVAPPFIASKCRKEAAKNWDRFYQTHADGASAPLAVPLTHVGFFKDRHWTTREFDDLGALQEAEAMVGDGSVLLEVGCGAGNCIWPLVERFSNLRVHACDFSSTAIDLVRSHPAFTEQRVNAFVHDLTDTPLRYRIREQVDIITCLFVLSAIPPEKLATAVRSMADCLRPGGVLLVRDYARNDSAQLRFHTRKSAGYSTPSLLSSERPLYKRADGTMSLFLGSDEVEELMRDAGLEGEATVVQRMLTNRKMELAVERRFVQGTFRRRVQF